MELLNNSNASKCNSLLSTSDKNPPIHYLNKLEYFIRAIIKKHF